MKCAKITSTVKSKMYLQRSVRGRMQRFVYLLLAACIVVIIYQEGYVTRTLLDARQNSIIVEKIVYRDEIQIENLYTNGGYWKEIEPFTHVDPSGFDKFVIFDSEDYSGSLEFLNEIPKGWSTFVVNNPDDAQIKTCPNCMAFSKSSAAWNLLEQIRHLVTSDVNVSDSTTLSTGISKMAASIFAYESNAPWIYVTDKRTRVPFETLTRIIMSHPEKGMVYDGPASIFQPCGHFMDTFTWNGKKPLKEQSRYVLRPIPASSLYQLVDNCQRQGLDSNWENAMDQNAPIPFVMPGHWAALDFQNILVPKNSSWTLFAGMRFKTTGTKSSTSSSTTSAVLSLLVQRILWEIDGTIGFVPHKMNRSRNSESVKCPTCDVQRSMAVVLDKGKRYKRSQKWAKSDKFLELSRCSKKPNNTIHCLDKAVKSGLVHKLSIDKKNTLLENMIGLWVKLLKEYGVTSMSYNKKPLSEDKMKLENIVFTPAKSLHWADSKGKTLPPNEFQDLCSFNGTKYSGKIPKRHPEIFNRVVLVISFNAAKYMTMISHLDFTFGRHFKHIVYCATGLEWFEKGYLSSHRENPVTFVDIQINRGRFGHYCAIAAMEMNFYNIEGYLYLSDDVILNVWNLYSQPFYLPWFQADIRVVNLNSTYAIGHVHGKSWYPWNQPTGQPAIQKSIRVLKSLKDDTKIGTRVRWFLQNLQQMSSDCDNCIAYMDADVFYIPSYMIADFRFFVPYFKGVFQELFVPTIIAGITPRADHHIYHLRGHYLIGTEKRSMYDKYWSMEELFLHPFKLSGVIKGNRRDTTFYCNILKRIDKDLFRQDLKVH